MEEQTSRPLSGNDHVLDTLVSMLRGGRIPHAFLLYGPKGAGRRTLACWLAEALVRPGVPAGKPVRAEAHPDIIWPERSGKLSTFTVETIRKMTLEAFTVPNDSDKKVFVLLDCDHMLAAAQNALLKLLEEPPPFSTFILTVLQKDALLPTVLSRVTALPLAEITPKETLTALKAKNVPPDEAEEAVKRFPGNVGQCLEWLQGGTLKEAADIAEAIALAIVKGTEYELLKALYPLESDRNLARQTAALLEQVLRDACVLRLETACPRLGCTAAGAKALAKSLSFRRILAIQQLLADFQQQMDNNVHMSAAACTLCGQIFAL